MREVCTSKELFGFLFAGAGGAANVFFISVLRWVKVAAFRFRFHRGSGLHALAAGVHARGFVAFWAFAHLFVGLAILFAGFFSLLGVGVGLAGDAFGVLARFAYIFAVAAGFALFAHVLAAVGSVPLCE